eukprot:m.172403 g.172403  ORF g.172403 m.172403 type:complete len:55 (+) comp17294_c0_seq2:2756-2920(+)
MPSLRTATPFAQAKLRISVSLKRMSVMDDAEDEASNRPTTAFPRVAALLFELLL